MKNIEKHLKVFISLANVGIAFIHTRAHTQHGLMYECSKCNVIYFSDAFDHHQHHRQNSYLLFVARICNSTMLFRKVHSQRMSNQTSKLISAQTFRYEHKLILIVAIQTNMDFTLNSIQFTPSN